MYGGNESISFLFAFCLSDLKASSRENAIPRDLDVSLKKTSQPLDNVRMYIICRHQVQEPYNVSVHSRYFGLDGCHSAISATRPYGAV